MSTATLTAEDLLAGADATIDVEVPRHLAGPADGEASRRVVRIRPLTLRDVQLIAKAARDDDVLISVLMIQRAVVEPTLKEKEIAGLRSGVVQFLVDQINRVSGLTSDRDASRELLESPIMQAFAILARELGWTPEQMRSLTAAQVVGYLDALSRLPTRA